MASSIAAFAGLVRSYFSNYREVRQGLGFLQLDEKEMLDLAGAGGVRSAAAFSQHGAQCAAHDLRCDACLAGEGLRERARSVIDRDKSQDHREKICARPDAAPAKTLDPIEIASRDEIAALQLQRLKATLRRVYDNVPAYRKKFDAAGVHPDDLKSLADLAKFPFTTKEDLRANYPFGLFAVPQEEIVRIHASSGTTGKPTVVGYTKGDIDVWAEVVARSIRASGGRRGMKLHNAYGYGLFTGGLGLHYGAEKLGVTVIPISGGMTERQVQLIADFEPDIITVTPSYMLAILDEFRRQGIDPRKTSLKVGIFGAEPWTNAMRAEIEQAFDMHAVDIYGLSEVIGPGVANECVETKDGLHLWEDHFYPEIIDPVTGKVLPDGEQGRAGVHHAHQGRHAGDPLPHARSDAAAARHGAQHAAHGEDHRPLRRHDDRARRQRVPDPDRGADPEGEGPRAALPDRADARGPHGRDGGAGGGSTCWRARLTRDRASAAELAHLVKNLIGVTAKITVTDPGGVERSQGKARRVIDKRAKE